MDGEQNRFQKQYKKWRSVFPDKGKKQNPNDASKRAQHATEELPMVLAKWAMAGDLLEDRFFSPCCRSAIARSVPAVAERRLQGNIQYVPSTFLERLPAVFAPRFCSHKSRAGSSGFSFRCIIYHLFPVCQPCLY